ncbi:MAG TPA: LytTR family DNA-binding domain-containing protein [Candidatus Angelobacter sp.]|nr:LytTR family DNA-binding domain-containing protein [Candidatus Angelobacter sp.]
MPIRTLIVDDEPLARERIALLLADEPDIQIVGECGDGRSTVRAIKSQTPNLIFLDIQLPEMDGFQIIEAVPAALMPAIIFVTAYDQFALKAFKVHAVDYLLKPVDREMLSETLKHLRRRIYSSDQGVRGKLAELIRDLESQRGRSSRIVLKSAGEVLCLKPTEIDWIESAGNYVCFHVGASTHIFRETMNQVEERLRSHNFLRIHRSAIVNLDRINRLKTRLYGDYTVELRDGTKLTLSRVYRQGVLKRIGGG